MSTIATVKTDGLNLRPNPSKAGRAVDILTKGDQLKVSDTIGPHGSWLHGEVTHTRSGIGIGESGWFDVGSVTLSEPKPKPVPSPQPQPRPQPAPAPEPVVIKQDSGRPFSGWWLVAGLVGFLALLSSLFWH